MNMNAEPFVPPRYPARFQSEATGTNVGCGINSPSSCFDTYPRFAGICGFH